MRTATINRHTAETEISLSLNLDGTGKSQINTGIGFLDHMLTLFAAHGKFDLTVNCRGDLAVDGHHTTEDIGICLGDAFTEALGERRGICRYGYFLLPMDEALLACAADFSGRPLLRCTLPIKAEKVGDFDTELTEEFLLALVRRAGLTLHVRELDGSNSHHIIEGLFKCLGRALSAAVAVDPRLGDAVPSTKGVL